MESLDQVSDDAGCYDAPAQRRSSTAPAAGEAHPADGSRLDRWLRIARTIEGEVIPRLLLAHRSDLRPAEPAPEAISFDAGTPQRFAAIVLNQHDDMAVRYVHALMASGFPLESVYLDLLAPTAKFIGQQWTDDELSLSEVTIALTRLQRLMRTLSATARDDAERAAPVHGPVLLAAMPGEQHMFGVLMLEEFCRRDGLAVECLPTCARADLIVAVKRRSPAVVGLSLSVDERLPELKSLITDIRAAAGRPDILIMVGGRCFNDQPDNVQEVGADFTAVDGREAISHIHWYLSNRSDTRYEP